MTIEEFSNKLFHLECSDCNQANFVSCVCTHEKRNTEIGEELIRVGKGFVCSYKRNFL